MPSNPLAFALLGALALLLYRSVPLLLWQVFAPGCRWRVRIGLALGFVAALLALRAGGLDTGEISVRAPAFVVYLAAVAALLFELRGLGKSRTGRALLLVLLPGLYLALPAQVAGGPLLAATLAIGWERMLAAYSLCVETSAVPISRAQAVFFLAVDPSLVWQHRARRIEPLARGRGLARVGLGVAQLAGETVVLLLGSALPWLAPLDLRLEVTDVGSYLRFVASAFAIMASIFLAHMGLASVQIGLLRVAGYQVTERYRQPYLAIEPLDFWRRWNRWVGDWARLYVFLPCTRWLARHGMSRALAAGLALVLTFAVVGAVHDLAFLFMDAHPGGTVALPGVVTFLIFAVVSLSWRLVLRPRPALALTSWARTLLTTLQWLLFAQLAAVVVWVAHPLLRQGRLPAGIARLWLSTFALLLVPWGAAT